MKNKLYQLTKFETPKGYHLPKMHPMMYSCPRCRAPQIVDSNRDVKCMACGMLFRR